MARIIKVKNSSGSTDTWVGQQLANGAYFQIPDYRLAQWRNDNKVFTDVGNGNLTVNMGAEPGDDISDVNKAWNWLAGNTEPPTTADGDWHIVSENFAT